MRKRIPIKTPLEHLNSSSSRLGYLQKRCEELQKIERLICKYLNPNLHADLHLLNYREHCLVIATDNAAVATRLRFEIGHLTHYLRQENLLSDLKEIKLQVKPPQTISTRTQRSATLSATAKKHLAEFADSLNDETLKTTLQKLAATNPIKTHPSRD